MSKIEEAPQLRTGETVSYLAPPWGGLVTQFSDVDGNSFILLGFDALTREIELRRREAAEKIEAERRATQELEIAKEIQARLFPQTQPPLRTLEYAGTCIQARQVGGDYYDFLDLGQERLGLIVGDEPVFCATRLSDTNPQRLNLFS